MTAAVIAVTATCRAAALRPSRPDVKPIPVSAASATNTPMMTEATTSS
jgi:hypothetical protein